MTTLAERIKKKLEFDEQAAEAACPAKTTTHVRIGWAEGAKYQNEKLAAELQPLLVSMAELLREISAKKSMTIYNYSEEFMEGANTGFREAAEIAEEALTSLESWIEGKT